MAFRLGAHLVHLELMAREENAEAVQTALTRVELYLNRMPGLFLEESFKIKQPTKMK